MFEPLKLLYIKNGFSLFHLGGGGVLTNHEGCNFAQTIQELL